MLVYGMLCVTYRKPYDFQFICPVCGHVDVYQLPISDCLEGNINLEKDQSYKEIRELDLTDDLGLKIYMRKPTLLEFMTAISYFERENKINMLEAFKTDTIDKVISLMMDYIQAVYIHAIEDTEGNSLKNNVLDHKTFEQVRNVVNELPDVEIIQNTIEEIDSKYTIKTGYDIMCANKKCPSRKRREPVHIEFDLIDYFFPFTIK
jgi:hypothetical protein